MTEAKQLSKHRGIVNKHHWGPSGTTERLQGSHDSIWGTDGLSYLRPRCIGAERPLTHIQSIYTCTYIIFEIIVFSDIKPHQVVNIYRPFERVHGIHLQAKKCAAGMLGLKMKAVRIFETSVTAYQLSRCNIPEDLRLQQHRCENLKSSVHQR